ncbi:hypothetical protein ACIBL3_21600 [Kribbella sp. NPDC050124]|uniref:hypothetical protein n=1 Tax=Kribbella sp. NPDC050124 TaxID=3364114 RepID=UPI0037AD5A79
MAEQDPLPRATAFARVGRCVAATVVLLARRQVHLPHENVGRRLTFADGSHGRVYRETVVERSAADPCILVVTFRLRGVHGWGHTAFRWESWLNTPLFVGFDGFVSKLWLAHDESGAYRGLYEWDGPERAVAYARALWRVLELVSVKGSIHYHVVPGLRRDELLADPDALAAAEPPGQDAWWRPAGIT